jgi:biotin carboxyl carrier protein
VDNRSIRDLGDGWFIVHEGARQWRVAVASDGEATWVFVNGQVARVERPEATSTRNRARGHRESSVMSPMPATVVSINAAIGQAVSEGDTVIVLEAMKMELPIKAPHSGVVKAVRCAKGDLVQPGVPLLEFE